MASGTVALRRREWDRGDLLALAPWVVAALAFLALFWGPFQSLARDWWRDPEAGHGLLLAPLALYLAWKGGLSPRAAPQPQLGLGLLAGAVVGRYLSGLAVELFTMRLSLLGALLALVVFFLGVRQLLHWWLPVTLLALSIPLPAVVVGSLALPLQLKASQIGAALLEWRHAPVLLAGNVIHLPGRSLFVTEACSGLRSLAALLALGVLMAGLWLRSPWSRIALVSVVLPIAVAINGVRIFLTGFLIFFVDPGLGEGLMHYTEGWALFVVAFFLLAGCTRALAWVEQHRRRTA